MRRSAYAEISKCVSHGLYPISEVCPRCGLTKHLVPRRKILTTWINVAFIIDIGASSMPVKNLDDSTMREIWRKLNELGA